MDRARPEAEEAAAIFRECPDAAAVFAMAPSPASTLSFLAWLLDALPGDADVVGHHVPTDGESPAARYAPGRILVVYGLESVGADVAGRVLSGLNRARDQVRTRRTRLLLILPSAQRSALYEDAVDLFAWRDRVLELPEVDGDLVLAPPPWEDLRDVRAGRLVGIVDEELYASELVRRLLGRVSWGAILDVAGRDPVLPALAVEGVQRRGDVRELRWREGPGLLAYARVPREAVSPWLLSPRVDVRTPSALRAVRPGGESGGPTAALAWAVGALLHARAELVAIEPGKAAGALGVRAVIVLGPAEVWWPWEGEEWFEAGADLLQGISNPFLPTPPPPAEPAARRTVEGWIDRASHGPGGPEAVRRLVRASGLDALRRAAAGDPVTVEVRRLLLSVDGPVLTTGWDSLPEAVTADCATPWHRVSGDADLPVRSGARLLLAPWAGGSEESPLGWDHWVRWRRENPRCSELVRILFVKDLLFYRFDPAEPRFVELTRDAWLEAPSAARVLVPFDSRLPSSDVDALSARGVSLVGQDGGNPTEPMWAAATLDEALVRMRGASVSAPSEVSWPFGLERASEVTRARVLDELLLERVLTVGRPLTALLAEPGDHVVTCAGVGEAEILTPLVASAVASGRTSGGPGRVRFVDPHGTELPPAVKLEPVDEVPLAWWAHCWREHPAGLSAIPALRDRASRDRPVGVALRNPAFALRVVPILRDPFDPRGPVVAALALHDGRPEWLAEHAFRETYGLASTEEVVSSLILARPRPLTPADLASVGLSVLLRAGWRVPAQLVAALHRGDPGHLLRPWIRASVTILGGVHPVGPSARPIRLSPWSIDHLPVTRAQFQVFRQAGGYARRDLWTDDGWAWRLREGVEGPAVWPDQRVYDAMPMTGVSWFEADAYLRWRGQRLPTEAEWDVAARRGCAAVPLGSVRVVGLTIQDTAGPYDMAGNVQEWCLDRFDPDWPAAGPDTNPRGPTQGLERTIRGTAGWEAVADPARRAPRPPGHRAPDLGFRGVSAAGGTAG